MSACGTPAPPSAGPEPVATVERVEAVDAATPGPADPQPSTEAETPLAPTPAPTATTVATAHARPAWLGTRVLPLRPDGFGEMGETPRELRDRRLEPPAANRVAADAFIATIEPAPPEVLARSTWSDGCPVAAADLGHVQVTFWGFDGRAHAGELLVHRDVAEGVADVFRQLYEARFPIEEMRIVRPEELDAPPTGDGNNTTSFVCRPTRGSNRWSQHAYGLAVDINPFHNPYVKGEVILPELARAYADRSWVRPGMIFEGDVATSAFDAIGWGWGGRWRSLTDPMHFSLSGT